MKNAKRRLDLNASTNDDEQKAKKEANNSNLKPLASSSSAETASSTKKMTAMNAKTASSNVTPDADVDKFLIGKRKSRDFVDEEDDFTEIIKPRAARKLVTPRDVVEEPRTRTTTARNQQRDLTTTRKSLKFTSDDTDVGISGGDLYYDSDDEKSKSKKKSSREYVPVHIYSNVDYHRRGHLALDQGTLRAYHFIRNTFHIPKNLETDPKFGALSGSCFEERVIRAYSLGQLEPSGNGKHGDMNEMLLVCSFCGDEGHKRDGCSKLLL